MGTYFSKDVIEGLEPLSEFGIIGSRYEHFSKGLDETNRLIYVTHNGLWDLIVDVSDKSEFEAFETSYRQGRLLHRKCYLVPISRLTNPR